MTPRWHLGEEVDLYLGDAHLASGMVVQAVTASAVSVRIRGSIEPVILERTPAGWRPTHPPEVVGLSHPIRLERALEPRYVEEVTPCRTAVA